MEKKTQINPPTNVTEFQYRLLFVSLIPPHYSNSLNLFTPDLWQNNAKLPNKYFIKQSYLILSWFYYLRTITLDKNHSGFHDDVARVYKKKRIKFFSLPVKKSHYTLTKAPMAHKKNSKEQFLFKFYFVVASFRGATDNGLLAKSCDSTILILNLIQKLLPLFSTNLLLIRTIMVFFSYSDLKFFNYCWFVKNHNTTNTNNKLI